MSKLYFVFKEAVNNTSTPTQWDLVAVYEDTHFPIFCEELKNQAKMLVASKYADAIALSKDQIPPKPYYPADLEQTLRRMRKQSNAYRLAGNLDAFFKNNEKIRELKRMQKQKSAYQRAVAEYTAATREIRIANNKYKNQIRQEFNNLANKFFVVCSYADLQKDDSLKLNIYFDKAFPHYVTQVDCDNEADTYNFSTLVQFAQCAEHMQTTAAEVLDYARNYYDACKVKLDNYQQPKDSPEFQSMVKSTIDAYYAVEKAQHFYAEVGSNLAKEAESIQDACLSVTMSVNEKSVPGKSLIPCMFAMSDIMQFGIHKRISMEESQPVSTYFL